MSEFEDQIDRQLEGMYRFELEKKDKIEGGLSLPAAVFFAFTGVVWYYIKTFPKLKTGTCDVLFILLGLVFIISTILACIHLIRCIWNYEYAYLPSGGKLLEYYNDIVKKKKNYENQIDSYKKTNPEWSAAPVNLDERNSSHFRAMFRERYAKAAEVNRQNNNRKSMHRHKLNFCLMVSAVLLFFSAIPLALLGENKVQEVRIVEVPLAPPQDVRITTAPASTTQEIKITSVPEIRVKGDYFSYSSTLPASNRGN